MAAETRASRSDFSISFFLDFTMVGAPVGFLRHARRAPRVNNKIIIIIILKTVKPTFETSNTQIQLLIYLYICYLTAIKTQTSVHSSFDYILGI